MTTSVSRGGALLQSFCLAGARLRQTPFICTEEAVCTARSSAKITLNLHLFARIPVYLCTCGDTARDWVGRASSWLGLCRLYIYIYVYGRGRKVYKTLAPRFLGVSGWELVWYASYVCIHIRERVGIVKNLWKFSSFDLLSRRCCEFFRPRVCHWDRCAVRKCFWIIMKNVCRGEVLEREFSATFRVSLFDMIYDWIRVFRNGNANCTGFK